MTGSLKGNEKEALPKHWHGILNFIFIAEPVEMRSFFNGGLSITDTYCRQCPESSFPRI